MNDPIVLEPHPPAEHSAAGGRGGRLRPAAAERAARRLTLAALALPAALSALFTPVCAGGRRADRPCPLPGAANSAPAPPRGRWPAPFPLLTYFSLLGGLADVRTDIRPHRQRLYFVLLHFLLAAGLTVIYAGDLVTAYLAMALLTLTAAP